MKTEKKLTPALEKKISRDWQTQFPELIYYRPRHLLRRVGPLVMGICLDRDSMGAIYKPCFHVHCLGKTFPCVSLTLCTQLRSTRSGGPDYVEVQWHEQKYKEAADRMRVQSLLSFEGNLSLNSILDAYLAYLATPMGLMQGAMLARDMIILLAWAGEFVKASVLLDDTLRTAKWSFQQFGSAIAFERECIGLINEPQVINETIKDQVEKLGLQELPISQLIV